MIHSIADLSAELFRPLVEQTFKLEVAPDRAIEVRLLEVKDGSTRNRDGMRAPFTLLFMGRLEDRYPQGTYALCHPAIGRHELLVVSLTPRAMGSMYEIVFG